ncbi:hypothetical protein [Staphylococcus phage VB-SauS-SA2]|nr:hypothetical protein [Staphylococcus phage VB-SauS-SA2]
MVNLKELEKIVNVATNDPRQIAYSEDHVHRPYDVIELTSDMISIIDYLRERQDNMRLRYPTFSDEYGIWFSYNNKLYRVVRINDHISIGRNDWLEKDDDYSFDDFLDDYFIGGYYYLDLDTKTVKSIWDNKEYIIKEND